MWSQDLVSLLCAVTKAREIQFTTLPEVVRTTVIHKYSIASPDKVVRVVELPDNIYEITVVTDNGNQIVFVKLDGTIVERPTGVVEERQRSESREGSESGEINITLDQVRSAGDRYEFVQDEGPDAIYIDRTTNKRVIIRGAAGQGPRGGVRTREENKTDIRTNEKTDVNKNMREEQRTQHDRGRMEQKDQGNRETLGNGQEQKNRDTSGNPREGKNADQRNMKENQGERQQRETSRTPGQQQSQEKSKGESKGESKGKAKPSPSS